MVDDCAELADLLIALGGTPGFCAWDVLLLQKKAPAPMKEDIIIQISNRLKNIRKEKNVTLQELADATGVSKGMLSQVENSRAIPSLPLLLNLMRSLGLDFNDFFKDISLMDADSKVVFRKKADYQPFEKENAEGFFYQRLFSTTFYEYHVDFVLLRLAVHAQRPMVSTDAFEFKYLMEGTVSYQIGEQVFEMEAGDSLFFDAGEMHNPINTGTTDALMLVVYFFKKNEG